MTEKTRMTRHEYPMIYEQTTDRLREVLRDAYRQTTDEAQRFRWAVMVELGRREHGQVFPRCYLR